MARFGRGHDRTVPKPESRGLEDNAGKRALLRELVHQTEEAARHERMTGTRDDLSDGVLDRLLPLLAADDPAIREAAAQLLASMRDKPLVLRRFMQYAKGIAFGMRDRAFQAMAVVADDVADATITLLGADDVDVVIGAIVMAGHSRDPRVVEALATLLDRDFDSWVRIPALETLATFPDPRVGPVLRARLEDPELRPAAMACLGRRQDPEALPLLMGYLDHERRAVRRAALLALESYRDRDLVAPLGRVAREDADNECAQIALELLDGLGAEGVAAAASIRGVLVEQHPDAAAGVTLSMERDELDGDGA